jgi:GT2 family glycosyltransferase
MTHPSSIVIVLYNGRAYIGACLASLVDQGAHEIIVIDNGSTDGGDVVVREGFPRVRLVRNAENIGFAAACNQGAALARGEVLAFLNQDTRVQPGWLDGLLAPLDLDPQVGLTTSKLLYMEQPDRVNLCGQDLHYSGLTFGRAALQPAARLTEGSPVGAVSGGAFAIRKDLWDQLGGFDPDYFMYYEDTDLSWRAWLAGYASWCAPDSIALHDAPRNPSDNALAYSARNRTVLLLKTWKLPTLFLLMPGLLLAELVDWALMAAYGGAGLRAKARALGWVVRNLGSIWARRKRAQGTRFKPDGFLLEQCSPTLKPAVKEGGWLGKLLVGAVNGLLSLNYWLACGICRALGI